MTTVTRLLTVFALSLFALPAAASVTADFTAAWSTPTEFADGSPLEPEHISHYDLACEGGGAIVLDAQPGGESTSYTAIIQISDGTYDCTLVTVGADGQVSEPAAASFTVNPPPGAPDNFQATISITFGG